MSEPNAPVYLQLIATVLPRLTELRVRIDEKAGWVNLIGRSGHRICIQKRAHDLPVIQTTLDLPDDSPHVVELVRNNGRIRCGLMPHPQTLLAALEMISDTGNPIPAKGSKRSARAIPSLADLLK